MLDKSLFITDYYLESAKKIPAQKKKSSSSHGLKKNNPLRG